VLNRIREEARLKTPLETGGVLAGYFSADDSEVVVTEMVGPGPKAKHGKCSFVPDYAYHRDEIGRLFDESNGLITYLGDWHTHPNGPNNLSRRDKRALRNIARFPFNYVDQPVMIVFGETCTEEIKVWVPRVWRILNKPHWRRWDYVPLQVVEF
jgi:integrative and conjugative element protein (TIGR02256 family)